MKRKMKWGTVILAIVLIAGGVTVLLTHAIAWPKAVDHILSDVFGHHFAKTTNLSYEKGANGESIHESYYTLSANEPFNLSTELIQADVVIEQAEGDQLGVQIKTTRPEDYRIDRTQTEWVIKEKKQVFFWPFGEKNRKKAEIILQMPTHSVDVNLEIVNGNVTVEACGADLTVETVNGQIAVTDATFKEGNLEAVNGQILVNQSKFLTTLDLAIVNGTLEINQVEADEFSLETVNGAVSLSNLAGEELSVDTVNGDFNGKNLYLRHLEVEQLSGKFTLVNEDLDYQIQSLTRSKMSGKDQIEANILNFYTD